MKKALKMEDEAVKSFGDEFEKLIGRGTEFMLIYSTDDPGRDYLRLHAGTQVDRLKGHPRFELLKIPGADHTFTPLWSQAVLHEALSRFLKKLPH